MNRMAPKAMLGVVGVLSLVVTTRALGVTYVVPIEANNINLALAHADVTEVLVRSGYTEQLTVHMKSGVPVRRCPESGSAPRISVADGPAVIFPSETTSGTLLEGFDVESSGNFATVDCNSAGDPSVASTIRDCAIASAAPASACAIAILYPPKSGHTLKALHQFTGGEDVPAIDGAA